LLDRLAFFQVENHRRIGLDRSDTIKARNRCDDDHVVAFEQRPRRRMPHAVDRLVYRGFFLDVRIRPRDIGLGLIIVIIADEIFDRVVREETLELTIKLRREDLVRREDQRGPLHRLDHLGHRERLARPRDAEQHLITLAGLRRLDEFLDRGRLIPRGRIIRNNLEPPPALGLFGP